MTWNGDISILCGSAQSRRSRSMGRSNHRDCDRHARSVQKGFESPPHIHNITYRGVVIEGVMHNDDPTAAKMWMPPGSFWTQPAGEDHTTAADGETNLIYLEIDSGPYLVKPSAEQFDNGERPSTCTLITSSGWKTAICTRSMPTMFRRLIYGAAVPRQVAR